MYVSTYGYIAYLHVYVSYIVNLYTIIYYICTY